MQETLILIVVLCVFVAIIVALIQWAGFQIPPVLVRVGWILVCGILLVIMIRLLWPLLTGGSLHISKISDIGPMIGFG